MANVTMLPCAECQHFRAPNPAVEEKLGPAPNEQEAQIRIQRSQQKRADQAYERRIVAEGGHTAKRLEFVPSLSPWCATKSDTVHSEYYFCDWKTGSYCDEFLCRELDWRCGRCGGDNAAPCGRGFNDAPERVVRAWELPLGQPMALMPGFEDNADASLGSTLTYGLVEDFDASPALIEGQGLNQTFLIFGGPGAGKTNYFKYLLARLLAHPSNPGCLLLDPKGVLVGDLRKMLNDAGRPNDLLVIEAGHGSPCNVLGNTLEPRELGRLLADVVLTEAPGVSEGGWDVLVADLLESATIVLHGFPEVVDKAKQTIDNLDDVALTARCLLDSISFKETFQKRNGDLFSLYPIQLYSGFLTDSTRRDVRMAAHRVLQFYESTEERQRRYVRQIIERSLGDLTNDAWRYLSATDGELDFYDAVIRQKKVVTVSVGARNAAFQRSLCTLIKSLFQQAALASIKRDDGTKRAIDDFFILASDEYAQVVAEGTSGLVSDAAFFSQSREAHCMSLLALQSNATARSRFPAAIRDRWEGILGNVGVKIFMRLNDFETAELASKLVGSRQTRIRLTSTGIGAGGRSTSDQQSLVEQWPVPTWLFTSRLQQGEALVMGAIDGRTSGFRFVRAPYVPDT